MSYDRDTRADQIELIRDPLEKARKEAENGVRQFKAARKMASEYLADPWPRPLRQAMIMDLHREAMIGIHPLAGTFRNTSVTIGISKHIPPRSSEVPDYVADMCNFVNSHWDERSPNYLAAYLLWRINWIHPFADGNGRTSRIVSYLILSMKLNSILPGTPTIPDQISENRRPEYYRLLEGADEAYKHDERHGHRGYDGRNARAAARQRDQASRALISGLIRAASTGRSESTP